MTVEKDKTEIKSALPKDVNKISKEVASYYDSSNTDRNYKLTWGEGNIHFGYYPDLSEQQLVDFKSIDPASARQRFSKAAVLLTQRLAEVGAVGKSSTVLDLGSGYGKPLMDMMSFSGCAKGVGLDISSEHVKAARAAAAARGSGLNVSFVKGSFTALPPSLRRGEFTHVTSNVAMCHLHEELDAILGEAFAALRPGGVLTACDYLGADGWEPSALTKEHVYKRLRFTKLVGHTEYKAALKRAGFVLERYEKLDRHMAYGYALLAAAARQHDLHSDDGTPLAVNYDKTVQACHELKEIAMNLFVARKPAAKKAAPPPTAASGAHAKDGKYDEAAPLDRDLKNDK